MFRNTYTYIYITTIDEKFAHEFEREQEVYERIWTEEEKEGTDSIML